MKMAMGCAALAACAMAAGASWAQGAGGAGDGGASERALAERIAQAQLASEEGGARERAAAEAYWAALSKAREDSDGALGRIRAREAEDVRGLAVPWCGAVATVGALADAGSVRLSLRRTSAIVERARGAPCVADFALWSKAARESLPGWRASAELPGLSDAQSGLLAIEFDDVGPKARQAALAERGALAQELREAEEELAKFGQACHRRQEELAELARLSSDGGARLGEEGREEAFVAEAGAKAKAHVLWAMDRLEEVGR